PHPLQLERVWRARGGGADGGAQHDEAGRSAGCSNHQQFLGFVFEPVGVFAGSEHGGAPANRMGENELSRSILSPRGAGEKTGEGDSGKGRLDETTVLAELHNEILLNRSRHEAIERSLAAS